jgi:hypothetical protein
MSCAVTALLVTGAHSILVGYRDKYPVHYDDVLSRIAEIPQSRSPTFPSCPGGGEGWLSVGQLWMITSPPTSSATATGSPQDGHEPPMPTVRMKVAQSMQRCSPRARVPQVSHA